MNKTAPVEHAVHPLIAARWSPRAFSARTIDDDTLASLLEAARWAPSCFNEQPWRYIVAERGEADAFARLLSCLGEGNQRWAKDAAVLMISVAATRFSRNDKPNRHAWHDVGLATAQLTLQATSMGLGVHQMAGFSSERARELYRIPEDFAPVAAIAIGYPGEPDALPEDLRERERGGRSRRALSETVITEGFSS